MATVIERESLENGEQGRKLLALCDEKGLIPIVMDKFGKFSWGMKGKKAKEHGYLYFTGKLVLPDTGFKNQEPNTDALHNLYPIAFVKRKYLSQDIIDIWDKKEPADPTKAPDEKNSEWWHRELKPIADYLDKKRESFVIDDSEKAVAYREIIGLLLKFQYLPKEIRKFIYSFQPCTYQETMEKEIITLSVPENYEQCCKIDCRDCYLLFNKQCEGAKAGSILKPEN